jgi:hypothetical protein
MSLPSSHREVKLNDGHLVDQIKNLGQKDWVEACRKLGLYIPDGYGKGSHCAVYKDNVCPPEDRSCCVVTLPRNIYPNFQRDLIKKVLLYGIQSGKYNEDDLWIAIGVKKRKK